VAAFILRRTIAGLLTLVVIATLSFVITRAAPGSPFSTEHALHPEIIKNYNAHYGLDKPLLVQYGRTMWGYLHGDLGPSMFYRDFSCNDLVWPGLRKSMTLGMLASILAFVIGLPLGILAAARQNRFADHAAMSISVLGICIPNFLLGPLLVMIFTFGLGWLPPARWPDNWTSTRELSKLVLPAFTLALAHVAYISRLARAGMLDVLNKDYIRTARAKGLEEKTVILRHALKNGITPVVSYAGPMIAVVITGSIVVESVFAIPGLGQHFIKSATNRDYSLIMACVLVYSSMVIALNIAVDVVYGLLDPRVRVS
jgi:oligopeptide transport system permease protein